MQHKTNTMGKKNNNYNKEEQKDAALAAQELQSGGAAPEGGQGARGRRAPSDGGQGAHAGADAVQSAAGKTAAAAELTEKQPLSPAARALRTKYFTAAGILAGVLAAGILAELLAPSEWAYVARPVLGAVGAALLWCVVAALWLCRDPERLLAKYFKRSLKLSLSVPAWLLATLLLMMLPGNTDAMEQELLYALGALLLVVLGTVVPVAALVCEVCAIVAGARHMRLAGESETPLYREGPFALALILCVLVVCVCGFCAYYLHLALSA